MVSGWKNSLGREIQQRQKFQPFQPRVEKNTFTKMHVWSCVYIIYIYMYNYIYIWLYMYILLTALASFCVRGHSYPGSICRILGTIYRIPETIYRIPETIYCIILILAFFVSKLLGLLKKKHSEAKAVTKPSVYNNSRTLMGFGPVF